MPGVLRGETDCNFRMIAARTGAVSTPASGTIGGGGNPRRMQT